jgi:hypothetical protein
MCCEFCHEEHRQMMGFLVQEEEEDNFTSSSFSSFYWFCCEAPHGGIKDPKSSVSKVCMHMISHTMRSC